MDRMQVCETCDSGSTPDRCTMETVKEKINRVLEETPKMRTIPERIAKCHPCCSCFAHERHMLAGVITGSNQPLVISRAKVDNFEVKYLLAAAKLGINDPEVLAYAKHRNLKK